MNKKVIQENYTPKLNLTFEPPIINDSFGVSKVDKILNLIDDLYPNTKWWYGGKPSEYNPFLHPVDDDDDESSPPEEICNFIIGYRDDSPNRITYGLYCEDDYYGGEIDGYKWLKDHETDYDETEGMFNQLNESVEFDLENYYQSKTLFYEIGKSGEPIKHDDIVGDDLGDLLYVGKRDGQYLICYYILIDNQKYEECVGGQKLLLKALMNREIVPVPYDEVGDPFNQLNEGRYQPRLNLRFEDGISDADELDKVLQVLSVIYPGLTWLGGKPITKHNVIRDEEEESFYYDPIYYLTIGFFSGKWDKLTYTSGHDRDISYADDEQSNYDWVDGYKWVRDNQINYDETDDIFQQLNESSFSDFTLEYDENNPLHKFDIFLDKTNTASDIKYILDLYKEFGIPSSKKNEWNNSDIDYCHEWFLDPKKDGQGMVIGTGVNASGYYIYWEGVKDDRPKVRSSMGTNKELITFDRFLELTSIDDDNIFD